MVNIRNIGTRVGADDVAQQTDAVLVGPLDVVEQQRDGLLADTRTHCRGGLVEDAQ